MLEKDCILQGSRVLYDMEVYLMHSISGGIGKAFGDWFISRLIEYHILSSLFRASPVPHFAFQSCIFDVEFLTLH